MPRIEFSDGVAFETSGGYRTESTESKRVAARERTP